MVRGSAQVVIREEKKQTMHPPLATYLKSVKYNPRSLLDEQVDDAKE